MLPPYVASAAAHLGLVNTSLGSVDFLIFPLNERFLPRKGEEIIGFERRSEAIIVNPNSFRCYVLPRKKSHRIADDGQIGRAHV